MALAGERARASRVGVACPRGVGRRMSTSVACWRGAGKTLSSSVACRRGAGKRLSSSVACRRGAGTRMSTSVACPRGAGRRMSTSVACRSGAGKTLSSSVACRRGADRRRSTSVACPRGAGKRLSSSVACPRGAGRRMIPRFASQRGTKSCTAGTDSLRNALCVPYDRSRWGTKSCTAGTDSRVSALWTPRDRGKLRGQFVEMPKIEQWTFEQLQVVDVLAFAEVKLIPQERVRQRVDCTLRCGGACLHCMSVRALRVGVALRTWRTWGLTCGTHRGSRFSGLPLGARSLCPRSSSVAWPMSRSFGMPSQGCPTCNVRGRSCSSVLDPLAPLVAHSSNRLCLNWMRRGTTSAQRRCFWAMTTTFGR